MPEAFGSVEQIAYPPQPLLPITNPVEISGTIAEDPR